MTKKDFSLVVKISLYVLLTVCMLLVPSCKKSTPETSAEDSADSLVPIDIKLPKPVFIGTPQDTRVPNLEKPLGKERPPFLAPEGTTNVALGKPVTSSDEEPIIGELSYITDADKETGALREALDPLIDELKELIEPLKRCIERVNDFVSSVKPF